MGQGGEGEGQKTDAAGLWGGRGVGYQSFDMAILVVSAQTQDKSTGGSGCR